MNSIPKIIHQIWFQGKDVIPEKYQKHIDHIKKLNVGWEYKIWDETSFLPILEKTPEFVKKYNQFKHLHQKIDFAKILILWHYGGFFLDVDVEGVKPLDSLLPELSGYDLIISYLNEKDKFILYNLGVCGNFKNCYNNGIIISKPKADILYVLASKFNSSFIIPFKMLEINYTTGPPAFNKIIKDYISDETIKNKSKIKVLNNDYFEPCIIVTCNVTENTYIKHLHDRTWFNGPEKFITDLYDSNYFLFLIIIFGFMYLILFVFYVIIFKQLLFPFDKKSRNDIKKLLKK